MEGRVRRGLLADSSDALADNDAETKAQHCAHPKRGDSRMQWGSEFLYQIITIFLFAVFFGLTLFFLSERDQAKFIWCASLSWVWIGAASALLLNSRILLEPALSGLLVPSNDPWSTVKFRFPKDAKLLNFGTNFASSREGSVVVFRFAGEDLVSMSRRRRP